MSSRFGSTGLAGEGARRSAAGQRSSRRRTRPDEGARLGRRAALPRHGRHADRRLRRRRAGRAAKNRRRPVRPLLEGVHAGHGRRCVRRAGCCASTAPVHHRDQRRRLDDEPRLRRRPQYRTGRDLARNLLRARFHGTVGANKNTIKILGNEGLHAQGYFVYDSKKSGSQTVSHLRFGPQPIRAPYLVRQAGFIGCHQFNLLDRVDVLGPAAAGATLLLNCARPAGEVWDALSQPVQEQILAKQIEVWTIDAGSIAREVGLAGRTNIILQTCFFALSGVLPREQAIERIKAAVEKTYGRRGAEVVARNQAAVDRALAGLHRVEVTERVTATRGLPRLYRHTHPSSFVRSRLRCSPVEATSCRSVRSRSTAPTRAEQPHTRSATSPTWSPPGTPTSASSAATAASSARTASFAPGSSTRRAWTGHRTGSNLLRSTRSACRTRATRCRSTSRTAPAAGSASRRAR